MHYWFKRINLDQKSSQLSAFGYTVGQKSIFIHFFSKQHLSLYRPLFIAYSKTYPQLIPFFITSLSTLDSC